MFLVICVFLVDFSTKAPAFFSADLSDEALAVISGVINHLYFS